MPDTYLTVGPSGKDNKQLGDILVALRDDVCLSRAEAAQQIGISSEYLRLIERGHRAPACGQMNHILNVYKTLYSRSRNQVSFSGYVVEFDSRIQEARQSKEPKAEITYHTSSGPTPLSRNERIGRIISLIGIADEETLSMVYDLLSQN